MSELRAALRLVQADDPRPPRPVDLLAQWSAFMAAYGCSPATVDLRVKTLRSVMAYAGVQDVMDLTRDDVVGFLGRPLSPWSRLTYWKSIGKWSEYLREFGHDPGSDLIKAIPRPATPAPVARPIDDQTVQRLLVLRISPRARAYVVLALYGALRVHEIAKIRGEDLDHDAGWLMVTGKGGKTKPIPIHREIAKLADNFPEFGYWFPSPSRPDQPVSATAVSTTIRQALKMAGSNATAHQLRDTAATRMQRTFKDIRVTQSMLRHSNISSTVKYTQAADEDLQAAVLGLDWGGPETTEIRTQRSDFDTMAEDQLTALAGQLLAALAKRQQSADLGGMVEG